MGRPKYDPMKLPPLPPVPADDGEIRFCHIPGCPGYAADTIGRIWSCKIKRVSIRFGKWKELATSLSKLGRVRVTISMGGKTNVRLVHQLVMEAFVGPRHGRMVLHDDDNPANNRLDNLAYGTQQKNMKDAYDRGRVKRPIRWRKAS